MKGLSPKQREVLNLINDNLARHKAIPTLEELAESLGVTPQTVFSHVKAMKAKGFLTRTGKARSIELSGKTKKCNYTAKSARIKVHPLFSCPDEGKTFFAVKIESRCDVAIVVRNDDSKSVRRGDVFECGEELYAVEFSDGVLRLKNAERITPRAGISGSVVGFFSFCRRCKECS